MGSVRRFAGCKKVLTPFNSILTIYTIYYQLKHNYSTISLNGKNIAAKYHLIEKGKGTSNEFL